jgi:hypothetical protein
MSVSNVIPKHIEDVLVTNRRGFFRNAGLLAVSFGVFGAAGTAKAAAQSGGAGRPSQGPFPLPESNQLDS